MTWTARLALAAPLLTGCFTIIADPFDLGAVGDAGVGVDGGAPVGGVDASVMTSDAGVDAGLVVAPPPAVVFPIEVFGEAGHVVATSFRALDAGAQTLALRVHRPTWLEDGTYRDRGPKMAVQVDDGGWFQVRPQRIATTFASWGTPDAGAFLFPMVPANVTCTNGDGQFGGCLSGTYATVRFTLPLSAPVTAGDHTLRFRFEGTDGVSMGYRVLDFDLKTASGASVVDRSRFSEDDPDAWVAPLGDAASLAEGKRLWESAPLLTSPIDSTPLLAHCNSCHALDGRDLVYFNYSTYSIVRRSEFHGVSSADGLKIASYLRSLDLHLPGLRRSQLGRPWNPPYQPGPGLDALPVARWAAGAGLEAVLDTDAELGAFLFPADGGAPRLSTSPSPGQPSTRSPFGADGYLNPREAPQAIQLPDWNSWLPHLAPEDITTDPGAVYQSQWYTSYLALRDALAADRERFLYSNVATRTPSSPNRFALFLVSSGFPDVAYKDSPYGLEWKRATTTADSLRPSRYQQAMKAWRNLRKWELFHRYSLEQIDGWTQTTLTYESPPGMRVWPTSNRDMFELGPHFGGPGYPEKPLTFNDTPVGTYWTTTWYTLQQIVNGGYHAMTVMGPVDWNYQVPHIGGGGTRWGSFWPAQPWRAFWANQFMYQAISPQSAITDFDWPLSHLADAFRMASPNPSPDLVRINDLLGRSFVGVVSRYPVSAFPRKTGDGSFADTQRLEPATATPSQAWLDMAATSPYFSDVVAQECHNGHHVVCYYLLLRRAHDTGSMTPQVLNQVLDWAASVWPLYPWAALRQ